MITGVTAVAPSGDGGPVRFAVSSAASSQASSTGQTAAALTLRGWNVAQSDHFITLSRQPAR